MIVGPLTRRAQELTEQGAVFVTATVVRVEHPTSAKPGNVALVHEDGSMEGFVGGVCAQNSVRLYSLKAIERGEPLLLRILPDGPGGIEGEDVGQEIGHDDGSVTVQNPCLSGGAIEVFLEPFLPAPRMIVAGDTPIAAALLRLGPELGLEAIDARGARQRAAGARPPTTSRSSSPRTAATSSRSCERRSGGRASGTSAWWRAASAARRCSTRCATTAWRRTCSSGSTRRPDSTSARARRPRSLCRSSPRSSRCAAGRPSPYGRRPRPRSPRSIPICGMTVLIDADALSLERGGDTHYFCGEGCRRAFEHQHPA